MQCQYACRVRSLPRNSWVSLACRWRPDQVVDSSINALFHRQRGGQLLRRDAKLTPFSMAVFRCEWFRVVLNSDWLCRKDAYLRWCGVPPILVRVPHRVPNLSRGSFRHNVAYDPFFQVHNDNWW